MNAVITWADGFGIWHARVPAGRRKAGAAARRAIINELVQREGPNFDPRSIHVDRIEGTHYRERP